MDSKKITTLIEGLVIAVLGVLIAIFGGGSVIDVYFAVISLVLGVVLLVLAGVVLAQKKVLDAGNLTLGTILVFIGSFLFTDWLSFAMLINILVIVLMGLGAALMLTGIYFLVKGAIFNGVGQLVIGALLVTFTILFITVPDFRTAFWIIAGIIIALYGVLVAVTALISKGSRKK